MKVIREGGQIKEQSIVKIDEQAEMSHPYRANLFSLSAGSIASASIKIWLRADDIPTSPVDDLASLMNIDAPEATVWSAAKQR